jgi:hypothetical protein
MRLGAIRILHEDLRALEQDLRELESRGVAEVDGVVSAHADKVSIGDIRNLCVKWKHYFPGKYSQNQWFTDVINVRHAVKRALEETVGKAKPESTENGRPPRKPAKVEVGPGASRIDSVPADSRQLQPEVERYMRAITEQVQAPIGGRASSVTAIDVEGLRLMLSTGEVDAFQEPCEGMNSVLQRAVAVRAILLIAIDKPGAVDLREAVALAQSEVAALQHQIAALKETGDLNAAVNLRACDRSLRKALEKMDKSLLPAEENLPPAPSSEPKRPSGAKQS